MLCLLLLLVNGLNYVIRVKKKIVSLLPPLSCIWYKEQPKHDKVSFRCEWSNLHFPILVYLRGLVADIFSALATLVLCTTIFETQRLTPNLC